jgi:hypothetical protein
MEEEALLISCCKQAMGSMTQTRKCLLQTVKAYDAIHQEP